MFEIYPGFEDLPLRVEVKGSSRTRMVVARIEEWPASRRAVVICAYEDDLEAGEWLLINHQREPLHVSRVQSLKEEMLKHAADSKATTKRLRSLTSNIKQAFARGELHVGKKLCVVRVCHLPALPAEPRLVLCDSERCSWHSRWQMQGQVCFEFESIHPIQHAQELPRALQSEWANSESDARFAWQWAQWKDAERHQRLLGEVGDFEEVSRIMRWVLITRGFTENVSQRWDWRLLPFLAGEESASINFISGYEMFGRRETDKATQLWQIWLADHFAPHKRQDWIYQHVCTRDYWEQHGTPIGTAISHAPPTAHEQLEAKLALRDWLRDAATPDVAARLMASLDD